MQIQTRGRYPDNILVHGRAFLQRVDLYWLRTTLAASPIANSLCRARTNANPTGRAAL
jgi:hypothetical protein